MLKGNITFWMNFFILLKKLFNKVLKNWQQSLNVFLSVHGKRERRKTYSDSPVLLHPLFEVVFCETAAGFSCHCPPSVPCRSSCSDTSPWLPPGSMLFFEVNMFMVKELGTLCHSAAPTCPLMDHIQPQKPCKLLDGLFTKTWQSE